MLTNFSPIEKFCLLALFSLIFFLYFACGSCATKVEKRSEIEGTQIKGSELEEPATVLSNKSYPISGGVLIKFLNDQVYITNTNAFIVTINQLWIGNRGGGNVLKWTKEFTAGEVYIIRKLRHSYGYKVYQNGAEIGWIRTRGD